MASSASFGLLFLLFHLGVPMTMGDISRILISGPLLPCLPSFTYRIVDKPSELCCAGAAVVAAGARSYLGKAVVCNCLKKIMEEHPLVTPEKAQNVSTQCHVELPLPSTNANCSIM